MDVVDSKICCDSRFAELEAELLGWGARPDEREYLIMRSESVFMVCFVLLSGRSSWFTCKTS